MASGDRIELLTADSFETAMSAVAQEFSVQAVKTNVDTANANINTIKNTTSTMKTDVDIIKESIGTASTAPTVTTTGGAVNTANTIQQKLQGISQYQIGATNSTGGSATAGNVMAKLNNLITNVANIKSAVGDSSLNSTVFIPSNKVLKTVLNTTVTSAGRGTTVLGCFVAKYSGTLRVDITGYSNTSTDYAQIRITYNGSSLVQQIYPTMPVTQSESLSVQGDSDTISLAVTTPTTVSKYIYVKAGDIIYFSTSKTSANTTIVCSNITIYGDTVSTY